MLYLSGAKVLGSLRTSDAQLDLKPIYLVIVIFDAEFGDDE